MDAYEADVRFQLGDDFGFLEFVEELRHERAPLVVDATVEAIQAQRLVRRVCQNCRTAYEPTREQLMELNFAAEELKGRPFYYGEGCEKCNNLGFKGRTGRYELLIMNDEARSQLRQPTLDIAALKLAAIKSGLISIFEEGQRKVLEGLTSLAEVHRVAK